MSLETTAGIADKICTTCEDVKTSNDFPSRTPTKNCTHELNTCSSCLQEWIRHQIDTKASNNIQCPECSQTLDHGDIRAVVDKAAFERYDALATRALLAHMPGFRWCLSPSCNSGQLHENPVDEPIFTCNTCGNKDCAVCDVHWHEGQTCNEYQDSQRANAADVPVEIRTAVPAEVPAEIPVEVAAEVPAQIPAESPTEFRARGLDDNDEKVNHDENMNEEDHHEEDSEDEDSEWEHIDDEVKVKVKIGKVKKRKDDDVEAAWKRWWDNGYIDNEYRGNTWGVVEDLDMEDENVEEEERRAEEERLRVEEEQRVGEEEDRHIREEEARRLLHVQDEAATTTVTKICPGQNCGRRSIKVDGCSHVTCTMCKAEYCWICLVDYKDILRIGNHAHKPDCIFYRHWTEPSSRR